MVHMAAAPTTSASLLLRVRDAHDRQAWTQFEELYAPLIEGFARKRGLQEADAADLRQEVLRLVARAVPNLEFDPQRGSFRAWLFTVVRNQLRKFVGKRRRQQQGSGDSGMQDLLEEQPAPDTDEASWDEEYQRRLFRCAAALVRGEFKDQTWQAFWQTGVHGQSAKDVAAALGMTVAAVYLAKSRVDRKSTRLNSSHL